MERLKLFDFNCDLAQSWGVYQNDLEYEIASYASSVNIAAGYHSGDALSIRRALLWVQDRNAAINAHIGYPDIQGFGKRKMDLEDDELQAIVIYQTGAIIAYAKTFDLEVEGVRFHGALKDEFNSNPHSTEVISEAIKKICPWLNIYTQNQNTKDLVNSMGLKGVLEVDFRENSTLDEIEETQKISNIKIDTIHFKNLEDIKRAHKAQTPFPINYARVESQI